FLAKDNVPFHAVSFPATLLGSGLPFKLVDTIKGFNWLTFERGKFSTSAGHGIFTDTALALLPADAWRWWLAANAPESADTDFTLARFVDAVNKDLADVFGNLVNRCLAFAVARFEGVVPSAGQLGPLERQVASSLDAHLARLSRHHEGLALRKAAEEVRAIWRLANAYLTEAAPWSAIKDDPARAATIVNTGINLVRVSALAAWPFIPSSAEKVLCSLGETTDSVPWPQGALSAIPAGRRIAVPPLLFPKIAVADLIAAQPI
ncbi:MAG TPA: class I tRNA ligase family protein, partial [Reyranella sp.]|nr:class I tRNA ligase family protein [Reyranella sp.]